MLAHILPCHIEVQLFTLLPVLIEVYLSQLLTTTTLILNKFRSPQKTTHHA